eukprot:gb/GEZJ01003430.1/.p1 GENE.gb/GEZJ01003430.1/~~gb/GEZJ01003430.1/.p1  ORF type:complete len:256 (-),score=22.85 gb/GEZJ01003430.1/:990-1757(-)
MVIVYSKEGKLGFPRLESPEFLFKGTLLTECFGPQLEQMSGTKYDMVFLYSTINEAHKRHISRAHNAIFHCTAPVDPKTKYLVQPRSEEYQWMPFETVQGFFHESPAASSWPKDRCDYSALASMVRPDYFECLEEGLRPWELPHWYNDTTKETTNTLERLGYSVKSTFEQYAITPNDALLRAETEKGRVHLKASNRGEGKVTALISSFAPELVRKPIYVNEEKEWMLMATMGRQWTRKCRGRTMTSFPYRLPSYS